MLNETIESNALESIIYFEKVFDFLIFSANRTVKKSIIYFTLFIFNYNLTATYCLKIYLICIHRYILADR